MQTQFSMKVLLDKRFKIYAFEVCANADTPTLDLRRKLNNSTPGHTARSHTIQATEAVC